MPSTTEINVDNYVTLGNVQNIIDIVKDFSIIDFRGAIDLVLDDDTIFMRCFSSKYFVISINGNTVQKKGGRKTSHIVDYPLLTVWMVEKI